MDFQWLDVQLRFLGLCNVLAFTDICLLSALSSLAEVTEKHLTCRKSIAAILDSSWGDFWAPSHTHTDCTLC